MGSRWAETRVHGTRGRLGDGRVGRELAAHPDLRGRTDGCTISWAPDGSRIAVAHGGTLELVDPDGSNRVTLWEQAHPAGYAGLHQPTWSPDGTRIAFNGWYGKGAASTQSTGTGPLARRSSAWIKRSKPATRTGRPTDRRSRTSDRPTPEFANGTE